MSDHVVQFVLCAGAIFFVLHGLAIEKRLKNMQRQLDLVLSNFDGLRNYLYEIDPQFDDERHSDNDLADIDANPMAAYDDLQLLQRKESAGRRTLNTRFSE